LSGWPISATLIGDESLSTRPMRRVTAPLSAMGAEFDTTEGHLPVTVTGGTLRATVYESPVASAQVKTAVLLAGLRAEGTTMVTEPAPSRDHTERLLPAFGVDVDRDSTRCAASITGPSTLSATDVAVPGDPSSAAFPAIAALLVPGSKLTITDVALNPTRIGFALVLERMGADLSIMPASDRGAEPVGTLQIRFTPVLHATTVTAEEIPSLVDEIPILAVAAAAARGTTRFEGVGELRVKESDRLEAIRAALAALGVTVRVDGDVLEIDGRGDAPAADEAIFGSATLNSLGDHRLAMAWAVAGLSSAGGITVERFEAVEVSYPGFSQDMAALGAW
ncbi:MAG: 3-phosphoshikimate 1-carboxyvinyltransferase, partial [Actinomycetota bacterium]|nr:3-phosphoshikimate 1-carboxyvinyltransferase [Actinomycetota bacterium]